MKRIYQASDLPEAHLVAGLLRQVGIETRVLNENAQGGLGDLPFGAVYPEVWINEDRDQAQAEAIIQEYEAEHAALANRFCPECGEENPGNFDVCWKCGLRF